MKTNYGTVSTFTTHEVACNRCDFKSLVPTTQAGVSLLTIHYGEKHSLETIISQKVRAFDPDIETTDSLVSEIMEAVEEDRKERAEAREAERVNRPEVDLMRTTLAHGLSTHSSFYSRRPQETKILADRLARQIGEAMA